MKKTRHGLLALLLTVLLTASLLPVAIFADEAAAPEGTVPPSADSAPVESDASGGENNAPAQEGASGGENNAPAQEDASGGEDAEPAQEDASGGENAEPAQEDASGGEDAEPAQEDASGGENAEPAQEDASGGENAEPAQEDASGGEGAEPAQEDASGGEGQNPDENDPEEHTEDQDEEEEAEPLPTDYTAVLDAVTVSVTTEENAFPEEVRLQVLPLEENTAAYQETEAALAAEGVAYDGMMALDIHFALLSTGEEIEPAGAVTVGIRLNAAAEPALPGEEIDADTLAVTHIAESGAELVADTEDAVPGTVEAALEDGAVETIDAVFEVESFSVFAITWSNPEGATIGNAQWNSDTRILTVLSGEITLPLDDACTITDTAEDGAVATAADINAALKGVEVTGDASLTLAGVTIDASGTDHPGIRIAPGVTASLTLAEGTENTVIGGSGYAGVEVGWASGTNYADLTIGGAGTLNAAGGAGSGGAGIGGSKANVGVYGNITINGGVINATGTGRSAGIGSSDNPMDGSSHGSYKHVEETWGNITINGGAITAVGVGNGAGIGGGNHTSSGKIIINDGVIDARGDSGIGAGLGSSTGVDKGPGYYFADVTINGGTVTAYATNNMGAGIGGGMYSDAYVTINGGTVTASVNPSGNVYQGGAGIGGGYQGCAVVTVTGGNVTATGGNGCPGIGNGALAATTTSSSYSDGAWTGTKNVRTGLPTIAGAESGVVITGGTVTAYGGYAGAGIGSGNSSEWCNVSISGGSVTAIGYPSSEGEMLGGAGIGSGDSHVPSKQGYMKQTDTAVSISGGSVIAVGGWGAAGIGSGADNTIARSITIGANADIQAYADGTKFAIDTRIPGGETATLRTDGGVSVAGDILQGTFVHAGQIGDYDQNPEGLQSIQVINDQTDEARELTRMPGGYRSFAATVNGAGSYTVYTDEASIGHGEGRFFSVCTTEIYDEENVTAKGVRYTVTTGALSDNCFLFPVKSVVVSKEIEADDEIKAGLDTTVYFALWQTNESSYLESAPGRIWIESIDIENGVPQGKAYFVDVPDKTYGVWEVAEDGGELEMGVAYGAAVLQKVTTRNSDGDDNDATIGDLIWTDKVTVINTYEPLPESGDVTLIKVGETDSAAAPLAGAAFALFEDEESEEPLVIDDVTFTAVSDDEGAVAFRDVPFGTYVLRETEAPEGYLLSDAAYGVTVTPEGFTINVDEDDTAETGALVLGEDGVYTIENRREARFGSLTITKTLNPAAAYDAIEPVTFTFLLDVKVDGEPVALQGGNLATIHFDAAGTDTVTVENIPVGAVVTVTEETTGIAGVYRQISADPAPVTITAEEAAQVSFVNEKVPTPKHGHDIVNTFEYDEAIGWQWVPVIDGVPQVGE